MGLKEYWEQNTLLLESSTDNGNTIKQARKLIICELMDIPPSDIEYYLNHHDYYKKFALGDSHALEEKDIVDPDIISEKKEGLRRIYEQDYYYIRSLYRTINCNSSLFNKYAYCISKNVIKELVIELVHFCEKNKQRLSADNKETIHTYISVYLLPIEIMNPYMKDKYSDKNKEYYKCLLSQWQTANEMAANITQQRSNMNNFYMSVLSILIVGVLFNDSVTNSTDYLSIILIYAVVLFIGNVMCIIWRFQISSYAELNSIKFDVINSIERQLPANVIYYEYLVTKKNAKSRRKKISFNKHEKRVAIFFQIAFSLILIILIHSVMTKM